MKKYALKDRLYCALIEIDEFKNLSFDRQGEIVMHLVELFDIHEKFGKSEAEILSKAIDDIFLKKDEWDYENDKVGC